MTQGVKITGDKLTAQLFYLEPASIYGLMESVLLDEFIFWTTKNEVADINFHDGRYWTYATLTELQKHFGYMSPRAISYAIAKLVNAGILIKGNYNNTKYDRTTWYAVNYDKLEADGFGMLKERAYRNIDNFNSRQAGAASPKVSEQTPTPKEEVLSVVEAMQAEHEQADVLLKKYPETTSETKNNAKRIPKTMQDHNSLVRAVQQYTYPVVNEALDRYIADKHKEDGWFCFIQKFCEVELPRLVAEIQQGKERGTREVEYQQTPYEFVAPKDVDSCRCRDWDNLTEDERAMCAPVIYREIGTRDSEKFQIDWGLHREEAMDRISPYLNNI